MSGPERARFLACAMLLCWAAGAPALENDSEQTIEWSADGSSSMSTEGGVRRLHMTENVAITQGSLEINGDEALLEYSTETNELSRVTVQGAPARYRQALDDDGGIVSGSGDTILFYEDEDGNTVIELVGNADISSREMNTSCETILYVTELELIRASGNCAGAFTPGND
ncbi:MAG: hypothetical protein OXI13_05040 [Gammaproteobacteria bacterium]|nr:hypothetical protein [Gammaproteobacteria bacterium]MYI02988.1 hypothetical protein [Gammaproteobacteria bacterium]